MRILQVSEHYFPYVGGISEHIHFLSKELRNRGHQVDILTSKMKNTPKKEDNVYRIGTSIIIPMNKSFSRLTIHPLALVHIRDFLRKHRYDIVHIHGSLAPTLPVFTLKYSKYCNFATFHAWHEKSTGYKIFRLYLYKNYFKKLDGIIAVSKAAMHTMAKYFPGEYRIIPNGIDIELYSPKKSTINSPQGFPKILFVGRLEPRKGLKYLLEAMPIITSEFQNARLVIIGKGPLEKVYKKMVKDELKKNIIFKGEVTEKEKIEYYRWCDVFCAPSIGHESFGITLLEAMATAKPVVCSRIPGYSEVVEEEKDALLAEPKNPQSIAKNIILLAKNQDLRKKLAMNGREKAKKYSWKKIAEKIENYYLEKLHQKLSRSS